MCFVLCYCVNCLLTCFFSNTSLSHCFLVCNRARTLVARPSIFLCWYFLLWGKLPKKNTKNQRAPKPLLAEVQRPRRDESNCWAHHCHQFGVIGRNDNVDYMAPMNCCAQPVNCVHMCFIIQTNVFYYSNICLLFLRHMCSIIQIHVFYCSKTCVLLSKHMCSIIKQSMCSIMETHVFFYFLQEASSSPTRCVSRDTSRCWTPSRKCSGAGWAVCSLFLPS